ncbi:MAG: helix-turn-helix domain-containing protein [Bacteroides sp.]|nr:helix-turn-helix domain-containing protein [Eubacterium sp.]MCM1418663.1 helix-turn-helix domain-containing protein [Roseburia sp.]MCM1461964.1 helix-turn-helix domain-containing protein [Bacteroides sp.]
MNIGSNIKYLRQKNNLTQEALAERLGVSYQAVSKWETGVNTPDISLLPPIAECFGVSIDALFSDHISDRIIASDRIKDDDVIRVVQMRGKQILDISAPSQNHPPIEIAFPHDCNNETQYFKVEVFGDLVSDSSVNGDVVCHGTMECGSINGDVRASGDIKVGEIRSHGNITCRDIIDAYQIQCDDIIYCEGGQVGAVKLNCEQYHSDKNV